MDRRARVRVVERTGDRSQEGDDSEGLVPLTRFHDLVEGPARDHLRDQVRRLALIRQLIEAWNRLVLQGHVRAKLQQEAPRKADVARDMRADGPHRDSSLQARMLSLVYGPQAVGFDFA